MQFREAVPGGSPELENPDGQIKPYLDDQQTAW